MKHARRIKKAMHGLAALALVTTSLAPANGADSVTDYAKYRQAVQAARDLFSDESTRLLVQNHGLDLMSVTWEDTGRSKNSVWGPNISDMSIQAHVVNPRGQIEAMTMPVVRYGNFDDKTADISPEKFTVLVGNERGQELRAVTLAEYLGNFRQYLHNPRSWKGRQRSLLSPRDTHVLVSPQVSLLPVPRGGEAKFNPVLFNYQSYEKNPAVLTILATREGTSATIIDNKRDAFSEGYTHGQRLFFNQNGERASLTAVRASDVADHIDAGGPDLPRPPSSSPVANGQAGLNMVLLIQVPLKYAERERVFPGMGQDKSAQDSAESAGGVEDAVIGHGDVEGPFTEIDNLAIERDHRFPIRVTVQFYKATDVPTLSGEDVASMKSQLDEVFRGADYVGSLVTEGTTLRPTEHNVRCEYPRWWNSNGRKSAWPLKVGDAKMTRDQVERHIQAQVAHGSHGWWYWCQWISQPTPEPLAWALEMSRTGDFKVQTGSSK